MTAALLTVLTGAAGAQTAELPVPCVAGVCGANIPGFVSSGRGTATISNNVLRVTQQSDRAIFNWASFNVGVDGRVIFDQPGANSIALNRIFQGDPSRILGAIEANGQIFLINQNGFMFGPTARVRTAGLMVSSLAMTDSTFQNGLLSPDLLRNGRAALESDGRVGVLDPQGNPVLGDDGEPLRVEIKIAAGARISTVGKGGRVMIASRTVDNAGEIDAPDGQVVLAAGEKVYLQASSDPALRGLLVEVDAGGDAWNRMTGNVSAARGNVTMVGLAVNQEGRVSATSTVSDNGSVRLLARDTMRLDFDTVGNPLLSTTRGGRLELGAASETTVLPELTDRTTAIDEQKQLPGSVELTGQQVFIRGGAQVRAPGGDIRLRAVDDARNALVYDAQARVRVESGAIIDASGSDATASVSRNVVRVELRGNELRDAPLQRDSVLRGKEVFVDARVGTPLADVSGAIAGIGRAIDERTSAGGNIVVDSAGDVVIASGATLDVSGGVLNYTGGAVQTTQLLTADGRAVDIGQANANQQYVGLINPTSELRFDRWGVVEQVQGPLIGRYEPGYSEGRAAGTLQFMGRALALDGNFIGGVTIGPNQREAARAPAGGRFVVGAPDGSGLPLADFRAPSINLVTGSTPLAITDSASLPQRPLYLPAAFATTGGFTRLDLNSNGVVHVPESMMLALAPGSALRITAHRVEMDGGVTAAGGTVRLASVLTAGVDSTTLPRAGVVVGESSVLDVRGTWSNELSLLTPVYRDGGEIDLAVRALDGELILGDGVRLLASGGASMSAAGTVTGGRGGRIGIRAGAGGGALEVGNGVEISAFGVTGARGGAFAFEAPRLEFSTGGAWAIPRRLDLARGDAGLFTLGDALFSDFGFASFDFAATGPRADAFDETLVVRANVNADARARTLVLDDGVAARPSGGAIDGFAHAVLAPDYARAATSIALRVEPRDFGGADAVGRLAIESGASLRVDARGAITLSSVGGVSVAGSITAPGGNVAMLIPNPLDINDGGYRAELGISFLDSARVDVAGIALLRPSDAGLKQGEVLAGGSVNLLADRGFIFAAREASFDLRGGSSVIDVPGAGAAGGYQRRTIGGAGGALTLRSPESIDFAAALRADAGAADTHAAGGSVTFQLTRQRGFQFGIAALADTYPVAPRTLLVTADASQASAGRNGIGIVNTTQLRAAGVDALRLEAGHRIELYAGADLDYGRSIQLAAPVIGISGDGVNVSAPYVSIGTLVDTSALAPVAPLPGLGALNVRAGLIEFTGSTTLSGVASANFEGNQELRLRGFENAGTSVGALRIAGDLTLRAPLIYPTTGARFTITAAGGASDRVRFESTSTTEPVPLSVAGSLTVNARTIEQRGRLIAPFGQIELNATDRLELAAGSVTAVSARGSLLPFGHVQLGTDWMYELGSTQIDAAGFADPRVDLVARDLAIDGGATVDLTGGGDLYAYEWMPGTGGSRDALAPGATPGLYAILPQLRDGFAPYDPQEFRGTDLKPGDSIYLSGAEGLPAGVYPLLPARYALLPGALLVSAVPGTTDAVPGVVSRLTDGTPVIAGFRTYAGTDIRDARTSGFALRPGAYGRTLATYQDSRASTFAEARRPVAPDDAARLSLLATHSFDLAGRVLSAANGNGVGAEIDIAAPNLTLRGAGAPDVAGTVNVNVATLQSWNAATLLLGGQRGADGRTIEVTSDRVTFAAGAQLTGREIIAVARDAVHLESGSGVSAAGGVTAPSFDDEASLRLADSAAGAAVLGVSGTRALTVARAATTGGGAIITDEGSRIASAGSLLIDAPRAVKIDGTIAGVGATWALGSAEIAFGGTGSDAGLNIDAGFLAAIGDAKRLQLAAAHVLTFNQALNLDSLDEIVIDTPLLRASGAGVDARLAATSLTVRNSFESFADSLGAANEGVLSLEARDVTVGPGVARVAGFGQVTVFAQREIVGRGTAQLATGGDLLLTATNLGAGSDADLTLAAAGTLRTRDTAAAFGDTSRLMSELGGRVALAGADIEHGGSIRVTSGRVELAAMNSLTLDTGSVLDVSGTSVTAAGRSVGSGGGALRLTAGGQLEARAGALLRVSGAGEADAGSIGVTSGGAADLRASFQAQAAAAARSGSFSASLGSLSDFATLNDGLEAGGFNERRVLRVAQGDLTLGAGHSISAHDVILESGAGLLTIAGSIDATSDNQRGRIELAGGAGLTIDRGASIVARGGEMLGRGGTLLLASTAGDVSLASGSEISLGGELESGRLTIRAAATADGMRLGALDSRVSGVDIIALQPVLNFDLDPNPGAAEFNAIRDAVTDYTTLAAPTLLARYAGASSPVAVRPGIDATTDGDLTLGSLDLSSWRFGGEAAALAFAATGSISIDGVISDGFRRVDSGANARLELRTDASSSLAFSAGGDVVLGTNARVRTGTGDLALHAAGNVQFGEGASIYTAGFPAGVTHVFPRGASFGLPTGGGRLEITAGGDVLGASVTQAVGAWQIRQGRAVATPPSQPGWGSDIQAFGWNAGTFGGGDIDVRAGGSIRDLSAAAADSASQVDGALRQYGGGVVELDAERDIASVFVHATRGTNVLRAGGALGSSRTDDAGAPLGSLFSMQEASLDLLARRGISVESVFNPTTLRQTQQGTSLRSYFLSFAADSRLRARSATGTVDLHGNKERLSAFLGDAVVSENDAALFALLPPSVQLEATDGDITLNGDTTMAPSNAGQLALFARRDILSPGSGSVFTMSDAAAMSMPTTRAPSELQNFVPELILNAASARHAGDTAPILVNAGRDIVGAYFFLPKFAKFAAGRDIRNTAFSTQNLRESDATSITAGRDFLYDLDAGNRQVQIGGPGRLDLVAARDVDLGFSAGISSVGRLVNPSLATDEGADITVFAGAGAGEAIDAESFITRVIAQSANYRAALETFVASTTGSPAADFEAAVDEFKTLASDEQRYFLVPLFFQELVESGREANNVKGAGFARGYAAIDALFPGSRNPDTKPRYSGDLKLAFSRIYTLADADISLLVPGGLLNVGLANPPPGLAGSRKPSELGIVAQRGGYVNIFTNYDVLVNQSRVFTLRGGDIAIWSTVGDIDAGRGAKSAISAPPPTILVDPSGRVTLDFAGAVAGSGIRAILTDDRVTPGDVDLIAPAGIVDAGDAGIGSAGNLNVAAQQVVGLDNIQVGGTSTGVPAETSSLGASLAGAAAAGGSAAAAVSDNAGVSTTSQTTAPLADSALGFLDVFLEGFGSEVCKPDDIECLKRNQK